MSQPNPEADLTSTATLQAYFANVLPADSNALISLGRDSGVPDDLLDALIRLPGGEVYETAEQLSAALTDGPL